ncbi:hypothetical protein ACN47E_002984 [Coniothyrium glycines]
MLSLCALIALSQPSPAQTSPPVEQSDIGNCEDEHVNGYPKLVYFFAEFPNYLHLRKFSELATRLLLYRQHESTVMKIKLIELEKRDKLGPDATRRAFCRDYSLIKDVSLEMNDLEDEQHRSYEAFEIELKKYEEALLCFDRLTSKV